MIGFPYDDLHRGPTMSTLKAIRKKCLDCSCGSTKSIKYCTDTDCYLWPYRFGLMPKTARKKMSVKLLDPNSMIAANVNLDELP